MLPILWTEESEEHIARHNVTPAQVEELVYSRPRWVTPGRDDTTLIFGVTDGGAHLVVVLADAMDGSWYVVTARPMTGSERKTFDRKGR